MSERHYNDEEVPAILRRRTGAPLRLGVWLLLGGMACREAAISATPEWPLSENPTLTIGTEGVAEAEFHNVAGAVRLSNGEIAVADGGTNQVRYFAPGGGYLRAFGRPGAGPGEFQSMGSLIRFGDTLAVHDRRTSRLTVFLGDSLLDIRMVRSSNANERFSIDDRLPDGRWVAGTSISPQFSAVPYRDSIAVGILPASGEGVMQWLGWFPGPRIVSIPGKITGLAGFFTWVHSTVAERQVVVLDGDQERLRRFSPDGTESPGASIGIRGEPLTPEIIDQAKHRESNRRNMDPVVARQWLDLKYGSAVLGDRLPAFSTLLADSQGLIWLESYRPDENQPGRYFILSIDARHVATVAVPAGFRATDIGLDYVLGVVTDADGVERIVMYGLRRN
ncbi:MAG TPA: hypothetical protein VGQ24_14415 [Gemmatimonadales bacterium]|jgi:hypothetical protein|nr:hypothetical protein [Gemmatimonadales bacterium]